MTTRRPRRIGRGDAERMLRGAPVDAGAGPDHLADLLAAAAAPARDGELDGEEAAVAAFRVAPLAPVTQPRREPMSKLLLAKLLTVKVAATALGAVTLGGVAVAATTGNLPVTGGRGGAAVSSTATPSAEVTAPSLPTPSAGAHVSAQLLGLCHAYTAAAGAGAGADAALASPGMSALVTAAGGRAQVDGFCANALAAQTGVTAAPGVAGGAEAGATGAGVGASTGPTDVGGRGVGLGVGASAGPNGAGLGVGVGSGAGVGTHAGPTGAGLGAQVPGAGVAATASPGRVGLGVGLGSGAGATTTASPGAAGLSAAVSAGASPSAHR
ncbi:conserved hypothetical protein [Frankia canadensis]|uniref:Uncharacterized protein n=1 Tax=Frankia canadensis TaxID=1836972 RepID=A0A2I2KQQ0_9ACTN|nr:hypothetical protein [Frankia canadensis]SNQ47992.1 conserved hypothetical protein [Frankia canadensis]SOU55282.1 conserved hypothetical protein [Frankia canadensis]